MRKFVLLSWLCILLCYSLLGQDRWPTPKARFRTLVDTTQLQFGESFEMTVTFEVDDDNPASIQFHQPESDVALMYREIVKLGLTFNYNIEEIKGIKATNGAGKPTTHYNLLKYRITPLKSGLLTIPSFQLKMLLWESKEEDETGSNDDRESRVTAFKSEPISVMVKAQKGQMKNDQKILTGNFSLEEKATLGNYAVGDTINYTLQLSGPGVGMNLNLPSFRRKKMEVLVNEIEYKDSLSSASKIVFSKQYDLSIIPLKKGKLKLGKYFQWEYQANNEAKKKRLKAITNLSIGKNRSFRLKEQALDMVLITDISESMDIEDYAPNSRRKMANELAKAYRNLFNKGRVIAYAGEVMDITDQWTDSLLDSLKTTSRGTAIGNAVWFGTESLSASAPQKIIILIGDGDSTSGNISAVLAGDFAKDEGVTIYTIGLGHSGKVPFGKDFYGRTNYVENTFSDKTLKSLAYMTGGQYFYMDGFESPLALMAEIKKLIELQ